MSVKRTRTWHVLGPEAMLLQTSSFAMGLEVDSEFDDLHKSNWIAYKARFLSPVGNIPPFQHTVPFESQFRLCTNPFVRVHASDCETQGVKPFSKVGDLSCRRFQRQLAWNQISLTFALDCMIVRALKLYGCEHSSVQPPIWDDSHIHQVIKQAKGHHAK